MRNEVFPLSGRVLIIVIYVAAISALCETLFVLIMRCFNPAIHFTGAFALVIFSAFCGVVPSWPSPSRLGDDRLDLRRRSLIFMEVSVLVAAALLAFYLAHKERLHGFVLIGFLSYLCSTTVFSIWRWKEIQDS